MNTLLRKWTEWKAKGKAAQVIVLDGAAEVERTKVFVKGLALGAAAAVLLVVLAAPSDANSELLQRLEEREALLERQNRELAHATEVAEVCLSTARNLQQILTTYHGFLEGNTRQVE